MNNAKYLSNNMVANDVRIYRNSNVDVLRALASVLRSKGFFASDVIIPEEVWVDGNPYIQTNATYIEISRALKEV